MAEVAEPARLPLGITVDTGADAYRRFFARMTAAAECRKKRNWLMTVTWQLHRSERHLTRGQNQRDRQSCYKSKVRTTTVWFPASFLKLFSMVLGAMLISAGRGVTPGGVGTP